MEAKHGYTSHNTFKRHENDREEKRNAGNDKGGNEQHYSSFKPIKTSKLLSRSGIYKIKYIFNYVYRT